MKTVITGAGYSIEFYVDSNEANDAKEFAHFGAQGGLATLRDVCTESKAASYEREKTAIAKCTALWATAIRQMCSTNCVLHQLFD